MLKSSARSVIRLRGVRQNNLKNFDLDLPLNQLIVVTGLSGSGKSSLAFDTLFAEGQRRYIETFSPYARQFFDRMDKPQVDSIEGIPPAIAIEQRNAVKTTRSTVGTMTEIGEYMKTIWRHVAHLHCRQCGRRVCKDDPAQIWQSCQTTVSETREILVTFALPLTEKLSLSDSLALVVRQGYQRLLVGEQVVTIEEFSARHVGDSRSITHLTVIQDRLRVTASSRPRFVEACEAAYHFGKGKLDIHELPTAGAPFRRRRFSNRLHCAECDLEYREPSSALFSFNHPVGACPACRGFGRIISIDYDLTLPDRSKTLTEGVVKPWQTGHGLECQTDLLRMCKQKSVPTDVPFSRLAKRWQDLVIYGEPDYGKDASHEWPRAWYGIKGYFRWLESRAYKMHVRVLLSRYRAYTPCPDCQGKRFQPEALLYRVSGQGMTEKIGTAGHELKCAPEHATRQNGNGPPRDELGESVTLADFYQLPVRDALRFIDVIAARIPGRSNDPLGLAISEVRARLAYLNEVGLGYLTLDRPTRSLSGGETERVNLTSCLGSRLVNTLFVLDEPSVGLHARDTERLVKILQQLRDAGNTVVVVEHEASVMRAANQILDLGPGHGATGGHVVFQGSYPQILSSNESLTGQYLSGRKGMDPVARRPCGRSHSLSSRPSMLHDQCQPYAGETRSTRDVSNPPRLKLSHATRHNLKNLTLEIPLARLVCVTGVSGSGKTTLLREVLLPVLTAQLNEKRHNRADLDSETAAEANGNDSADDSTPESSGPHQAQLSGAEHLVNVVLVDQSILGKTPRSNPAVYIGAFEDIRELYAQSEPAKRRGLNASAFSFNSSQGQCERCRGVGFEKIEMQFLSDVYIKCQDCDGRRYRPHILEVRIGGEPRPVPNAGVTERKRTRVTQVNSPTVALRATNSGPIRGEKLKPLSIAELLDSTVEEAIEFLGWFAESRPAKRAARSLKVLAEVGLGYLKLGQPINTLSGGECQRLKLVRHLAEAELGMKEDRAKRLGKGASHARQETVLARTKMSTLFLFDEPTTGLHFEDVRILLRVFQRLVDAGHSVIVIEHNLEVVQAADWIIDLGPDAGDQGGRIVAEGTPEQIAACPESQTGKFLRQALAGTARVS